MLTKEQAFSIAHQAFEDASPDGAREIEHGWYFRLKTKGLGCNGLVVSKANGKVLTLGSAFPVERDLALYDRGYQFASYDLVVTSVARRGATCETLSKLGMSVVEPTFEHGSVWRVPRRLAQQELWQRLEVLPCVFGSVALYFVIEHLELARLKGDFTFEVLEFRGQPP